MNATIIDKLQTAIQHHQDGDVATAAGLYAAVLQEDPKCADAWHLSGLAAYATGNSDEAETLIRRAINLNPEAPEFKANLAAVLVNQNNSDETEELCRSVLATNPNHVAALTHLGTALRQQGRHGEALDAFRSAVCQQPDATSLVNLSSILLDLALMDEAFDCLTKARDLAPNTPQIHINLAPVLRERGEEAAALEALATAEKLAPDIAEIFVNRGNLQLHLGQPIDAIESFQHAIARDSSAPMAVAGLGRALEKVGCWEESLEAQRLAKDLDPSNHGLHSSYLYATSLSPLLSPAEIRDHHVAWGRLIEGDTAAFTHTVSPATDRALRIGYVSPDFRSHATMKFLMPLLQAHDRSQFDLYFYSQTGEEDETTDAVRELSDGWCATRSLSDDQLAERIRQDQIDILVDLAGHTAENRLPVFARKPAPVQVSFLGYPATTGLSRIDYYFSDETQNPPELHSHYSEKLLLLPNGMCCYRAGKSCDIAPPPSLSKKRITLGSTHRLEKLSDQTLTIWAQVLTHLPEAQLLIFRDVLKSESLRDQTMQRLETAGIDPTRIQFGWELPESHLDVYADIDILLDVFPWGSGTTAYDAMWMGVPVPTMLGDRCSARGTGSLVHYSGFPELATSSIEEYLQVITELAHSPTRLQELRNSIRPSMQATVGDNDLFARDMENAYRRIWAQLVEGESANISDAVS